MVYPFVIPFDVALLLYVLFYLQWHTIIIKECHGHFSCRWIVLQSLAQSSRSAQKKHRHHNSFGVHAWQNSNHLGWIELTQFMGLWIICRYFLTMWPILYHIHWLLKIADPSVHPRCRPRPEGSCAQLLQPLPSRNRSQSQSSGASAQEKCRRGLRFSYPQSGEKRTPSITSIIQFPTRLLLCWTMCVESSTAIGCLLCAVSSISLSSPLVNGGGDVSLQGQIERIQPLYYSAVLMYRCQCWTSNCGISWVASKIVLADQACLVLFLCSISVDMDLSSDLHLV